MVWQPVKVVDELAIGDTDTTYEVDLPKELITALHLRIAGNGGATTPALAYTDVTNVRIDTDGRDKKPVDLSAVQLVRRAGIIHGIPPTCTNGAAGAYCDIPFSIYFGTKPRDSRLMLDLRNSNQRKLKLTFSGALVGVNDFAAGQAQLTVIAIVWRGGTPPEHMGHIRQEQVYALATGTGDTNPIYDLPMHSGGKLAFMDFTVSAVTTVENIELTARSDSMTLINQHFRDLTQVQAIERHLDTELTLTAYYDWMFISRYEDQVANLPDMSLLGNQLKLIVERGATTTTLVIVMGTILH
jgi:hypothetical protein